MPETNENIPPLSTEEKRQLLTQLLEKKLKKEKSTYPLSYAQQALWFLYQMAPQESSYNVAFAARICSDLDVQVFKEAFQELINRHPCLRTTFIENSGQPLQEVHGYRELCFEQIDSSAWDENNLYQKVLEAYRMPFDLRQGPVLRVSLFTLSPTEHVFLLVAHHIIIDVRSLWIILNEFRSMYTAKKAGTKPVLSPLSMQYADYINWESETLNGYIGDRHWEYWQHQLGGALPVLNLPTDRPRPPVQTFNGASHSFLIDKELTRQIKMVSQTERATLYMALLAAFQTLLYRYTYQEDVLVGSSVTARNRAEFADIVGYMVNVVVLRAGISGDLSFRKILQQTRQTVLDMLEHGNYPFPLLVERLKPERDPSRPPVYQVTFDLQRVQKSEKLETLLALEVEKTQANFGDLTLEPYQIPQQEGQADLGLQIVETDEVLRGVLKYNTDLFEPATVARMTSHFKTILEAVVADPDCQVSEMPLLSASERKQLLVDWNATQANFPREQTLVQLFEAQAGRTPNAEAINCEDESITYKMLNHRANQLARHLQTLGVGPEVLVGVYMKRSVEMIVALLAILKAGGAYIPLDPSFPQDRLAYMIEDCQAKVLLTQQHLLADAPHHQAQVVRVDADLSAIAKYDDQDLASRAKPDNLAYVIYTSGSSGRPKGVQIEHRTLVNFLTSMQREPGLTADDVLLSVTTLSFDIAGLELFLPLLVGAKVVIASSAEVTDGKKLLKRMTSSQATVMQATPATWQLLLASDWPKNMPIKVLCGGEAMPRELADALLERSSSVWNMYGPTETTVWSTTHRVTPGSGTVPIGRPIANTQIYILDAYQQPVPIGISGELYIGGEGVARGYLNQPGLTAEKFVLDPFHLEPGHRLYRTGDLARYRSDGTVDYLGRIDHQVKVRGFRIELGEIETVLSQQPFVRQAVVIVREDQPGNKHLVAYIIAGSQTHPSVNEFRTLLKEKLPDYMIPSHFVFLDSFPLTPNGKINRLALPAVDGTRPDLAAKYVAPQSDAEKSIAQIWEELLSVRQVGIHDNFFDLGGHSLLATQVISRIKQKFTVDLPIQSLFKESTVAELARIVIEKKLELAGSAKMLELLTRMESLAAQDLGTGLKSD